MTDDACCEPGDCKSGRLRIGAVVLAAGEGARLGGRAKGLIEIDGEPLPGPNTQFWPVELSGEVIGKVTSAVYSPRLKKNIALAMVASAHSDIGTSYDVQLPGETRSGAIVPKPFYDPKKQITAGSTTAA